MKHLIEVRDKLNIDNFIIEYNRLLNNIEYWEKMDENEDKSDLGELLKLYGCKDIIS